MYPLPFARLSPRPSRQDPIEETELPDPDCGRAGVLYRLASGREGTALMDQALDYNADPRYVAEMLRYRLSAAAAEALQESGLGIREVARQLRTSPAQLYRLIDPTSHRNDFDRLVRLLTLLGKKVVVSIAA